MTNKNYPCGEVVQHITSWLFQYATNINIKGFVVGISGGIDSAVVSTLCALTNLEVLCVEMPIHQHKNQQERAKNHIDFLKKKFPNVKNVKTDLSQSFDTLVKSLPQTNNLEIQELTLANTRARLRMTTLYYFAGIHQYLVVGTGNKIEDFGVGFFTKYGDGGVDISPIADLLKSQVYQLATFLQLDPSIIQAKPTDGLFGEDRSDEDQLGANYDELEQAMNAVENGITIDQIKGERAKEVYNIYTRLNKINQHKINPIPVCIIPETF